MDAPDVRMDGKICIVTGSNAGIGKRTALGLARRGAAVVMACRSAARGEAAQAEIAAATGSSAVDLLLVDLSSQSSVRAFAKAFRQRYDALHVLINNAAVFDFALKQPVLTQDGVETVFATNHLGPFLLTNLLLDVLKDSAPARILNVASKGLLAYPRLTIAFDNLNGARRYSLTRAYYHSKLAQVLFTYALAQRVEGTGVTVNCIRVPSVRTDEDRDYHVSPFMSALYRLKRRLSITPEEMAETYLYLATAPALEGVTGMYFDEHGRAVRSNRTSYDRAVWQRLWDVSARLTGLAAEEGDRRQGRAC